MTNMPQDPDSIGGTLREIVRIARCGGPAQGYSAFVKASDESYQITLTQCEPEFRRFVSGQIPCPPTCLWKTPLIEKCLESKNPDARILSCELIDPPDNRTIELVLFVRFLDQERKVIFRLFLVDEDPVILLRRRCSFLEGKILNLEKMVSERGEFFELLRRENASLHQELETIRVSSPVMTIPDQEFAAPPKPGSHCQVFIYPAPDVPRTVSSLEELRKIAIRIVPGRKYRLEGYMKSVSPNRPSRSAIGLVCYDSEGREISVGQITRSDPQQHFVTFRAYDPETRTITVARENADHLRRWLQCPQDDSKSYLRAFALYPSFRDFDELPDRVYRYVRYDVEKDGQGKLLLRDPLDADAVSKLIAGETVLVRHLEGGDGVFYCTLYYDVLPADGFQFCQSAVISGEDWNISGKASKFRKGTKYVRIYVVANDDRGGHVDAQSVLRDLRFREVFDD